MNLKKEDGILIIERSECENAEIAREYLLDAVQEIEKSEIEAAWNSLNSASSFLEKIRNP